MGQSQKINPSQPGAGYGSRPTALELRPSTVVPTSSAAEESGVGLAPVRTATEPAQARKGAHADLTALALAARAHEPAATRAFLLATAPLVRGVCRSVLGAGHVELDDTIQECLIKIVGALPQYRAEGSASNYAQQIALHCAIATRKRARARELRLRLLAEEASAHTFDVHVDSLPSLRLVRDVIDDLPEVQAEAMLMRIILGFSFDEIALATNVSINTVKSRLRVAKENLRRRLEERAQAPEEPQ